jgi:4-hydroxymandelate oxidase
MNEPVITLHDHERAAQAALDPAAWAYFSGGAGDELTLRRNVNAWQDWQLAPRVLQDLRAGHTRCTLLGREWPMPLLVAPMAHQRWAHHHGEMGMAMAAAAQGCGLVLSHQSSTPLQDVASTFLQDPNAGPLWFQMYWQSDRNRVQALLSDVEDAAYQAIVLTVDAPVQGVRDRERIHGAALPESARAVHWPAPCPLPKGGEGAGLCAGWADIAPRWEDVQWLIGQTRLPVLLKGITHPDDARRALAAGAAGLVVSNHGGRVLDTMPATAHLLADIVAAVRQEQRQPQSRALVLVDGGIRRGTDLFKALALGADAALIGRPALYGLAHGGARGAAHVLRLLRDEFEAALVLCGCAGVAHIHRDHVRAPSSPFGHPSHP